MTLNRNLWSGYVNAAIPLLLLLSAMLITKVSQEKKPVWIVLTAIVLFSNILNLPHIPLRESTKAQETTLVKKRAKILYLRTFHSRFNFPFVNYIRELLSPYDGPVEGIVQFLNQNAKKGDRYFTNNDYHTIRFATGLQRADTIPFASPPQWIFRRGKASFAKNSCAVKDINPNAHDYVYQYLSQHRYEKIVLDYPNLYHENEPIPSFHYWRTPKNREKVVIYRYAGNP